MRTPKELTPLDAVVTTTTSDPINVTQAKKITMLLTRASHTSGNGIFTVLGSINGKTGTYTPLNSIIQDLTNINTQDYTRVASITLSSNTSVLAALDIQHNDFTHIKIKTTRTTDGTQTAKVLITY